jgi:hypothetical protein
MNRRQAVFSTTANDEHPAFLRAATTFEILQASGLTPG